MHSEDVLKLKQYMEKIKRLEEEKSAVQENISDVFKQAKDDGFDPKIMKRVLKLMRMKSEERENEDLLLDTYMVALGLVHSNDSAE